MPGVRNCGTSIIISPYAASTTYKSTALIGAAQMGVPFAERTETASVRTPDPVRPHDDCDASCPVPCTGSPLQCPSGGADDGEGTGCTPWYDCSPLVLDLNGDGIHTTSVQDSVSFDLTGDGVIDRIAWTNPTTEEAFLWLDVNHNGRADDGTELFGIGTVLSDGRRARHGFEALAQYDQPANGGNGDGTITTADRIWNRLRLWVDSNHDGRCEPSESGPVERYGLASLELRYMVNYEPDENGNIHGLRSTYDARIRGDHASVSRSLHDVFFLSKD